MLDVYDWILSPEIREHMRTNYPLSVGEKIQIICGGFRSIEDKNTALRALLEEAEPGMLDSPLIQFAFGMTISELIAQSPGAKPLYQAVIDGLNEKARKEIGI